MNLASSPCPKFSNWEEHVKSWQASGLSMSRYCQQYDLAVHHLGNYKRKVKSAKSDPTKPATWVRLGGGLIMTEVMRPFPQLIRVFLYRQPVDFRKLFRGLSAVVKQELRHNVFDAALYAFTNRRRNKMGTQRLRVVLQKPRRGKIQIAQAG